MRTFVAFAVGAYVGYRVHKRIVGAAKTFLEFAEMGLSSLVDDIPAEETGVPDPEPGTNVISGQVI